MDIKHDYSLKNHNTFGIDARADHFVSVRSVDALKEVFQLEGYLKKFILGGGSNMLLKTDIHALVIHIDLKGICTTEENEDHVFLEVAAGENWHEFVLYCVSNNYGGLENLALIPGNVGTSPVQNIGAYGVELKDTLSNCTVLDRKSFEIKTLTNAECKFGYRDSVFKTIEKDRYIILSVGFKLTKKKHQLHTEYGAIKETLKHKKIETPSLKDIAEAVIEIRQTKLPDPKLLGNSGSFFKNPVIDQSLFKNINANYLDMPHYPAENGLVKIPAGWLVEQTGLKGKRFGNAGVHDRQALVLVNHGNATGAEVWEVALKVKAAVKEKFCIDLQVEVNIIDGNYFGV